MKRLITLIVVLTLLSASCSSADETLGETVEQSVATDADADDQEVQDDQEEAEHVSQDPAPTASPVPAEPADPVEEFLSTFDFYRSQRAAELAHLGIGDIESTLAGELFPQQIASGSYTTSVLGTELSFELDDSAIVAREFPGMLTFIDVGLAGTLHIARPNAAITPEGMLADDPFWKLSDNTEAMPEDFHAWLRSIPVISVSSGAETEVGGQPATRYEIVSMPDDFYFCNRGTCMNLLQVGVDQIKLFGRQEATLWHLDQPGGDIVIVSKAEPDAAEQWFGFSEQVVGSLSFGEPQPSPITSDQFWGEWGVVGPGQWTLPGIPWSLKLERESTRMQHRDGYVSLTPFDGESPVTYGTAVAKFVEMRDGTTATVDTFGELLGETYGQDLVTEGEPTTIFGHEARTFNVAPTSREFEFKHTSDAEDVGALGTNNYALFPFPARVWVFERDDEVWVAIVGADSEEQMPVALAWADEVHAGAHISEVPPTPLTDEFAPVAAGTYVSDGFGVPLTIDIPDGWWVQPNGERLLVLTTPESRGPSDHDVVVVSPTTYGNSDGEPGPAIESAVGAGLEAWLEKAPASLSVSDVTTTTVGDRSARIIDVQLTANTDCFSGGESCLLLLAADNFQKWLSAGPAYRLMWFEDDTPAVIVMGVPDSDKAWLDIGQALVENMAFD